MKTKNTTNRTRRFLTTLIALTMVAGIGYGQGLLVEGAAKLFNSMKQRAPQPEFVIVNANYTPENESNNVSFSFAGIREAFEGSEEMEIRISRNHSKEFNTVVLHSFNVNNIDVAFENEIRTEGWMTESFSENLEIVPAVEEWMTVPFSANHENAVETEEWMTVPLSESFESGIEVEGWMTEGFYNELETSVEVEEWMTEPLYNESLEQEIEVEAWMTTPICTQTEEPIEVEGWMTELLY